MSLNTFINEDYPATFRSAYRIKAYKYPNGHTECTVTQVPRERAYGNRRRTSAKRKHMSEENLQKCSRRARTNVRRSIMNADLDRMMTLTFRDNMTDIIKGWRYALKFIRAMRDKYGEFKYVIVPEFQKRGAVHFHIAYKGFYRFQHLHRMWWKILGLDWPHLDKNPGELAPGNVDSTRQEKYRFKNAMQLASYLSKYITKAANIEFTQGTHRFRAAQGIKPEAIKKWLSPCPYHSWWAKHFFELISGRAIGQDFEGDSEFRYFLWLASWEREEAIYGSE